MTKHIFLIDDDEQELQSFMDAFNGTKIPFRCTYINNTEHAVQVLGYMTPDIIFLELSSTGIDGLKCLKAIKEIAAVMHVPVVVYSYLYNELMFNNAMDAGAALCFRKPYHADGLSDKINEILRMEWQRGPKKGAQLSAISA